MNQHPVTLVFATHNEHKAEEIQSILPGYIEVKTLQDLGCYDEIPEEKPDFKGNALQKATYIHEKFGVNCFADDSGLEIDALNGEPGIYSARYAGPKRDSNDNMDLVLKRMQGKSDRKARFKTIIALIMDGKEYFFEGTIDGKIRDQKSGNNGFGYDPIFEPESCGKTFAEMSLEEKNSMSHRSRAIQKMAKFFIDQV
ncbi:MAG: RdgB/HAM1 family non-canonical purine NTP pyrophosphatase [Brumimicrobium sp.]|nr:RdgB/HAM1 family non-canonical purine NTP pyrophosphatase [Brumimicrobium sp.]